MKEPTKVFCETRDYVIIVFDKEANELYQERSKISAKDAYVVVSDMILDGTIEGAETIVIRQSNANCGFMIAIEKVGIDIEGEIYWMFNDNPYFIGKTMSLF